MAIMNWWRRRQIRRGQSPAQNAVAKRGIVVQGAQGQRRFVR